LQAHLEGVLLLGQGGGDAEDQGDAEVTVHGRDACDPQDVPTRAVRVELAVGARHGVGEECGDADPRAHRPGSSGGAGGAVPGPAPETPEPSPHGGDPSVLTGASAGGGLNVRPLIAMSSVTRPPGMPTLEVHAMVPSAI